MNELALFAGAGGGLLASHLLGWCTVCAVEIDSYCRSRLLDRQRDRCLPVFPIWDDVRTFDGHPWRGHIDVISGGFPCQDISAAGQGRGISGARSGLVFEMLRIVDEVRPAFVFAENSPQLRTKGLATIVERFISMGYVGRVGVLGARDIGANHKRKRMWVVATHPDSVRRLQSQGRISEIGQWLGHCAEQSSDVKSARRGGLPRGKTAPHAKPGHNVEYADWSEITNWWSIPRFEGVDDGLANRLDRIKATGNGQVPGVAALAWSILTSDLKKESTRLTDEPVNSRSCNDGELGEKCDQS